MGYTQDSFPKEVRAINYPINFLIKGFTYSVFSFLKFALVQIIILMEFLVNDRKNPLLQGNNLEKISTAYFY